MVKLINPIPFRGGRFGTVMVAPIPIDPRERIYRADSCTVVEADEGIVPLAITVKPKALNKVIARF